MKTKYVVLDDCHQKLIDGDAINFKKGEVMVFQKGTGVDSIYDLCIVTTELGNKHEVAILRGVDNKYFIPFKKLVDKHLDPMKKRELNLISLLYHLEGNEGEINKN